MEVPKIEIVDPEPIGRGAFSEVYKGTYNAEPVAIKRLLFREDGRYFEEAKVLAKLRHENIVCYIGVADNRCGTYDVILELTAGGTLAGALHRRGSNTEWKRSTIHQISSGLAYLHALGILHLDLKPPNILFRDRGLQRALIADFGMAVVAVAVQRAGAKKFRAPDCPFTQKSDVYSLASIACCVFAERNPANLGDTTEITFHVLEHHDFEGNSAWRLALEKGVDPDNSIRPTAQQFCDAFQHSQFQEPQKARQPRRSQAVRQGRSGNRRGRRLAESGDDSDPLVDEDQPYPLSGKIVLILLFALAVYLIVRFSNPSK